MPSTESTDFELSSHFAQQRYPGTERVPTQSSTNGASTGAIRYHYDIGNQFYRLWLDPTLTYSCAMWEGADSLEQAQTNKIDYHIRQSGAMQAKRVLDIGCGWGGVLRRMVDNYGVRQAVGLTLSKAQADWISAFADPRIQVETESWADHRAQDSYDAIISIGAIEHFARRDLRRNEKIESYRTFFKRCNAMLKPNGLLSLQTISFGNVFYTRQLIEDAEFVYNHIFPESELPYLEELFPAVSRLFEVQLVRNDRLDSARTCRVWLDQLQQNRTSAIQEVGEEVVSRYERYLGAVTGMFEAGVIQLLRLTLRRITRPSYSMRFPIRMDCAHHDQ